MLHFEISAWETLYNAFISRPEPRNGVQTEFEWDYYSQAVLLTIFDNIFQLLALTYVYLFPSDGMVSVAYLMLVSQSCRFWPFIDGLRQRREAIESYCTRLRVYFIVISSLRLLYVFLAVLFP